MTGTTSPKKREPYLELNYQNFPIMSTMEYILEQKKQYSKKGNHIIIAAAPKSGSTYLAKLMVELTGYPTLSFVRMGKRSEQDFYEPFMLDWYERNVVVKQHCMGHEANIDLLRKYQEKPVILSRNLFDMIISRRDHIYRDEYSFVFPTGYIDQNFYHLCEEEQLNQLIEIIGPWYINFYVNWYHSVQNNAVESLWLTYEELLADKVGTLKRICDFYGLDKSIESIESAVAFTDGKKEETRFNQGVSGRGNALLTDAQKSRLQQLTRFYPDVDFSRLGLSSSVKLQPLPVS